MLTDASHGPIMVELQPEELQVLVAWHDGQGDAADLDDASPGSVHWRRAAELLRVLSDARAEVTADRPVLSEQLQVAIATALHVGAAP